MASEIPQSYLTFRWEDWVETKYPDVADLSRQPTKRNIGKILVAERDGRQIAEKKFNRNPRFKRLAQWSLKRNIKTGKVFRDNKPHFPGIDHL